MNEKKGYRFEDFEEAPRHRNDVQLATITKAGNIYLNKRFRDVHWEEIQLDQVIFGYDRENCAIRLQMVGDPAPNSYPIREMPSGKGLVVSARAFLNHYGIPYRESSSYEDSIFSPSEGEYGALYHHRPKEQEDVKLGRGTRDTTSPLNQ